MSVTANVDVQLGIKSWRRRDDLPFRPTDNWTSVLQWQYVSDSYQSSTATSAQQAFDLLAQQQAIGAQSSINIAVTVENVTANFSGKGVVPMAKQHLDFMLSEDEFTAPSVLETKLNTTIADLLTRAKYL